MNEYMSQRETERERERLRDRREERERERCERCFLRPVPSLASVSHRRNPGHSGRAQCAGVQFRAFCLVPHAPQKKKKKSSMRQSERDREIKRTG